MTYHLLNHVRGSAKVADGDTIHYKGGRRKIPSCRVVVWCENNIKDCYKVKSNSTQIVVTAEHKNMVICKLGRKSHR